MMAQQFNPDPSDLSNSTIKQLFYNQIRNITISASKKDHVNSRLNSFDRQFSDVWF